MAVVVKTAINQYRQGLHLSYAGYICYAASCLSYLKGKKSACISHAAVRDNYSTVIFVVSE